jgi:hypothetical protein
VVEPPLPLFPAGSTATCPGSPSAGASPDPAPHSSRDGDPSGPAAITPTDEGPRPSPLAPTARFARPILVYQRWARLAPAPSPPPVAPPSPASPMEISSSPPGTPGRRRSPNLLALSNRCITRRFFTATRIMFILW